MNNCPHLDALPAVIEHRQTCPHCRAARETPGTVRWWALQFCEANGTPYDLELDRLLDDPDPPLPWTCTGADRARLSIVSMARFCVQRSKSGNGQDITLQSRAANGGRAKGG